MTDSTRPVTVDAATALAVAKARPTVRRIDEHPGPGRLGRHVRHDPRSRSFPAMQAVALRSVAHRRWGPVLDQGQLGSCTGNALTQALMCVPLHQRGRRLTEETAIGLYSRASELDPFPGQYPPEDTGSDGLDVCKAAVEAGLITAYHHAFGLDEALAALVLSPVIVGMEWRTGCDIPDADAVIRWTGPVRGGHEVCVNAIDVKVRRVRILNSWGARWGRDGAAWLSFDDLGAALAADGDCTVPVS